MPRHLFWYERQAIEAAGIEGWRVRLFENLPQKIGGQRVVRLTGNVVKGEWKSGRRKGALRFSKSPSTERVFYFTDSELEAWADAREKATGECKDCEGRGLMAWKGKCKRCHGTGKVSENPSPTPSPGSPVSQGV